MSHEQLNSGPTTDALIFLPSTFASRWCLNFDFSPFSLWSLFNSSDAIFSALYDGSGVIEILRGHEYLSHPFAVSLYGGNVYWTDWRTNTLARANKWTGQNVTVIQKTSAQPFDLQIFHPSRQPQGSSIHRYMTLNNMYSNNNVKTCLKTFTGWIVVWKLYIKCQLLKPVA